MYSTVHFSHEESTSSGTKLKILYLLSFSDISLFLHDRNNASLKPCHSFSQEYLYCLLLHANFQALPEPAEPALVPLVLVHCAVPVKPTMR
jgi:hypothetical protein